MSKTKIVILGAGYGGLRTLKGLQKKHLDVEITLVNKNDYHYEATYLHEVASGAKEPEQISFQIKDVVDPKQTTFIQDTVIQVNKDEKTVNLEKNGTISFDYLVFALGFESESFGIPGVEEFGLPMVTIDSAVTIREHMHQQFAAYQESQDDSLLSIVVCGAGFTSIEYLGELTQQLPKLAKKYNLPVEKIQLTCIEAMPTLLPMFADKLANYGIQKLKDRGVQFIVGTPIKEITQDTVIYEENEELKSIKAKTIVWTTGVKGSSVVGQSGFEERRGRVMVESDLTAPGYSEIFVIGDCSAVMDPESNRPYPTTAQIALKQADGVVTNLVAKLNDRPIVPFTFKSQGSVCSIGNNEAIGEVLGANLKGYPASVMKKIIEDKSLSQTGGLKIMFNKGRFDLYH
ncbi:NAD(P)/FAD-dependent oxidoreductase [Carnobacterium gallinarum]|uniref:NAD(P)/FAD-dependent oxidoreductase n=1 Tax=Carnobacterium gallinarum TaxID=2749 RepID=UPI00054D689B|nr:NAD(P)/FAD-dependent oxidoreductase [Carnobacterium gallinarum]